MNEFSPSGTFLVVLFLGAVPVFAAVGTSYLKIQVIFNLLKSGIGTQGVPGAAGVFALALILSSIIMADTVKQSLLVARDLEMPSDSDATLSDWFERLHPLILPWRDFLKRHAGERERETFLKAMKDSELSSSPERTLSGDGEVPIQVLFAAFVLTELKEACAMGLILLLPFLVIDLVVANLLVGLGMFMVSPVFITVPLKLLLLVMTDGWLSISEALIYSYR